MKLVEHERARWARDGYLHLPNLLPPVVRDRIRSWVVDACGVEGPPSLAPRARCTAASLARRHAGMARILNQGLLPDVATQLLGAPARPAEPMETPSARQLTCVLALEEGRGERLELAPGRHHEGGSEDSSEGGDPPWIELELSAGDVLWLHGLTPLRTPPEHALSLEYRAVVPQPTFGWSEDILRVRA